MRITEGYMVACAKFDNAWPLRYWNENRQCWTDNSEGGTLYPDKAKPLVLVNRMRGPIGHVAPFILKVRREAA